MTQSCRAPSDQPRRAHRAVIFDLDGTLADTLRDIAAALNHGLASARRPAASIDAVRSWVGDGLPTLCRRAWIDAEPSQLADLIAAAQRFYREHYLDHTTLYPGIRELLGAVRIRRVPAAVLSNKPHELTRLSVHGLGIEGYFTDVLGYVVEAERKPAPTVPLRLAREWSVRPEEVLFVGDGIADLDAAMAAGMTPLSVTWGFRTRAELMAAGAQDFADRPLDVLDFLANLA